MKGESSPKNIDQARAEAELQKLHLEIKNLKYKNRWESKISLYIPLITVLVGVFGFLFGIYQFQSQQKLQQDRTITEQQKDREARKREQDIRLQNQIRVDVDQLLQFTSNKDMAISRVVFLLDDLQRLSSYSASDEEPSPEGQGDSKAPGDQVREITKSLLAMVVNDCNLTDHRHTNFTTLIASDWGDTLTYLEEESATLRVVLDKYIAALAQLQKEFPEELKSITYDAEKEIFFHQFSSTGDMATFYYFTDLINGFNSYLGLLKNDSNESEDWTSFVREFQRITCNPTLTKQIFGRDFSDVTCED